DVCSSDLLDHGEPGRAKFAQQVVDDPVAHGLRLAFAGQRGGGLKVVGQRTVPNEHRGQGVGQTVLFEKAFLLGQRQLGALGLEAGLPLGVNLDRHEVGVREVAVVVRHFLGTQRLRGAGDAVVVAGFLHDDAAGFEHGGLATDLMIDAVAHVGDGVEVLELDLHAELLLPDRTDGDVGVAAQLALLHVAVGDAGIDHGGAQRGEVGEGLLGRLYRRIGYDLHERRAGAVVVHQRIDRAVVELADVFFEMDAGERDAFVFALDVAGGAGQLDLDGAADADRLVVLGNLVVFGRIRVEVVFAVPFADRRDL